MIHMLLEWVLTAVFLILAVLLLRALLGKRVSAGLRYALWGIVLVRLLVPVQLFPSPVAGTWTETERQTQQVYVAPSPDGDPLPEPVPSPAEPSGSPTVPPLLPSPLEPSMVPSGSPGPGPAAMEPAGGKEPEETDAPEETPELLDPVPVLLGAWLAGSALLALVMAGSNLRFTRRLRRRRTGLEGTDCPLPVYTAEGLPSPCLFGLVRPAVYVTAETAQAPSMLRHILAHEYTHFRHLDHIWNLLRCLALCLHWWNPLVWLAAVLSRRDGELCCDEGAIKRLGDGERLAYGRTLLALLAARPGPGALLTCATTMNGSKKSLKERVERIARAPRRWLWAAVVMVLAAALACLCAFGRAQPAEDTPPSPDSSEDAPDKTEFEDSFDPNQCTVSAGVRFFDGPSGTDCVQMEGLGLARVEYHGGSAPQLHFAGDPAFCCSSFNGWTAEGDASWTDGERTALSVSFTPDTSTTYFRFVVELERGAVTQREVEGISRVLTDAQMVGMARILDSLMRAAERYALTGDPELESGALPFAPTADLNRNGVSETLRVGRYYAGDGVTPEGLYVEVWEGNTVLWTGQAPYSYPTFFRLCTLTWNGPDYLLEYHPYGQQGIAQHSYRLFDLTGDGADGVRVLQENAVEFPYTEEGMERWKQSGRSVDLEAVTAFETEIDYRLLPGSTALADTTTDEDLYFLRYNELRRLLIDFPDFSFRTVPGGEVLTFRNLTQAVTPSDYVSFVPEYYTILDMDQDEESELIVQLSGLGDFLIFRQSARGVECYHTVARGLQDLKVDGTFMGSNGAADWGYYRVRAFTASGMESVPFTWCESAPEYTELYFVNGNPSDERSFGNAVNNQDRKQDALWQPWAWEDGALDGAVEWLNNAGV